MTDVSFTADPDGLDTLSSRLSRIHADMGGLSTTLGAYDRSDLSRRGEVWQALTTFNEKWSARIEGINGSLSALHDRLAKASSDYRGTDQGISSAAQQASAGLADEAAT